MTYEPAAESVAAIAGRPVGRPRLTCGRGCTFCRGTGFDCRLGLFELLLVTDELRQALVESAALPALRAAAREQGMTTLKEDGWAKVQAGITTVEEVLRVVQD